MMMMMIPRYIHAPPWAKKMCARRRGQFCVIKKAEAETFCRRAGQTFMSHTLYSAIVEDLILLFRPDHPFLSYVLYSALDKVS